MGADYDVKVSFFIFVIYCDRTARQVVLRGPGWYVFYEAWARGMLLVCAVQISY